MSFVYGITWPTPKGLFEIAVMATALYYVILFFQGTRGAQVLSGFAVVIGSVLVLTYVFNLDTLTWLLQRFSVYLAVAILIIFQPEIRRALAELGRQHFFSGARERPLVESILRSAIMLAEGKIGALIAIEREVDLQSVQVNGTPLDAMVTPELLSSIFYPHTPLHDGGVIIRADRIAAAGCLFPLSQRQELSKSLGTRHRAAIGLTEETDALVLVVSEETGTISLAFRGKIRRGLDEEHLRRIMTSFLGRGRSQKQSSSKVRRAVESVRKVFARWRKTDDQELNHHAG